MLTFHLCEGSVQIATAHLFPSGHQGWLPRAGSKKCGAQYQNLQRCWPQAFYLWGGHRQVNITALQWNSKGSGRSQRLCPKIWLYVQSQSSAVLLRFSGKTLFFPNLYKINPNSSQGQRPAGCMRIAPRVMVAAQKWTGYDCFSRAITSRMTTGSSTWMKRRSWRLASSTVSSISFMKESTILDREPSHMPMTW